MKFSKKATNSAPSFLSPLSFSTAASKVCFMLLLLFFASLPMGGDAYVVLSRLSSQVFFSALVDLRSRKIVSAGVDFRPEHAEITTFGQADTQCVTSIGDVRGFDRTVHVTPQMCVLVKNFPMGYTGDASYGIVAGIAGRQATLYRMDFLGNYDDSPLLAPMNLPIETFPVAMTTDINGGVYVGLHDTGGLLVPPITPSTEEMEMQTLLDYKAALVRPEQAVVVSPEIVKVNMTTSSPSDQVIVWSTTLDTVDGQSTVGGIVHIPSRNILVVAGSTNGRGTAVGANAASSDWDGFVTIIDDATGTIDDSASSTTSTIAEHSRKINSQFGQDDFIYDICANEDKIFVIGSSTGIIDGSSESGVLAGVGGAFAMQLDVDTLSIIWKKQFAGDGVEAVQCATFGSVLFVAGHVPASILVGDDSRSDSSQNQDIMVAALEQEDGNIRWIRQIDSRRDDILNGVLPTITGDIILTANAANFEDGTNDIYSMSITLQDGIHDWLNLPEDADPIDGQLSTNGDADYTTEDPPSPTMNAGDTADDDRKTVVIALSIAAPLFLCIVVAIYSFFSSEPAQQERKEETFVSTTDSEAPRQVT